MTLASPGRRTSATRLGLDVARLIAGSWRREPGPPTLPAHELPAALERGEARLLGGGCGALVWWRLRDARDRALPAAHRFQSAYRHHALRAAVDTHIIAAVVRAARDAGAEPLLLKGWATSRRYPEPGLRPFGDIDLLVRPGERAAVERALADGGPALASAALDLHDSIGELADRPLDELLARAEVVPLGDAAGTRVRVLCVEDHLRHLALHLLRHGAWRPLWLCDVGLILETEGRTLDWDRCMSGGAEGARRVACAIGLAHRLLGAELPPELPPAAARTAVRLPHWLVGATLRQWGSSYERYTGPSLANTLRGRGGGGAAEIAQALRRRWPNPIEATVSLGMPFNRLPRLPIQVAEVLARAGGAAAAAAGRSASARPRP